MKKTYVKPTIISEQIKVGVFGCYGGNGGNGDYKIPGKGLWGWWFQWRPRRHNR